MHTKEAGDSGYGAGLFATRDLEPNDLVSRIAGDSALTCVDFPLSRYPGRLPRAALTHGDAHPRTPTQNAEIEAAIPDTWSCFEVRRWLTSFRITGTAFDALAPCQPLGSVHHRRAGTPQPKQPLARAHGRG